MEVPWTRITDQYVFQINEETYPYQRHVPFRAHYIDIPRGNLKLIEIL